MALCICKHSALRVAVKMYHKSRMTATDFQQVCGKQHPRLCVVPSAALVNVYSHPRLTLEQAEREICVQAALQCEHVVALYAAFEDGEGVYLVQARAAQEPCCITADTRYRSASACSAARC